MRRRQLTLRAVMAVIVAWGVLLAWVGTEGAVIAAHSTLAWALSSLATFAAARALGPHLRGREGRIAVSMLLAIVVAAAAYLAWAHWRSTYFIIGLDRDLPYPDPWINALERWFDARNPAPPDSLKLHGEYPIVQFILGMLVIVLLAAAGWLAGVLSNRADDRDARAAGAAGA